MSPVVLESIETEETCKGEALGESTSADDGGWRLVSEVEKEKETIHLETVSQVDFTQNEVETIQNHLKKTEGPKLINLSL